MLTELMTWCEHFHMCVGRLILCKNKNVYLKIKGSHSCEQNETQKELLFRVINAMHVWMERISMLQGYYVWYLDVCNKNRNETIKNMKNSFLSKKYVGHWINWMNFWTRFFSFPCDVLGEYFLILTETYIKAIFSPKIITFRSIHDFNRQLLTRIVRDTKSTTFYTVLISTQSILSAHFINKFYSFVFYCDNCSLVPIH